MDKFKGNCLAFSSAKPNGINMPISDTPSFSILEEGNQFVLDCLDTIEGIHALKDEWKHLEETCSEPFIYFQTYDWCAKWCETFLNSDNETQNDKRSGIHIYTLRRNGELVMVWPLMTIKSRFNLYTQSALTEPHGQYANIICSRKHIPLNVGKSVWKFIKKSSKADVINLDYYPADSFLAKLVASNGVVESTEKFSSAMDLTVIGDWDEYRASLSRSKRKRRNQRRRRLEQLGEIKYEVHFGGTPEYSEYLELGLKWKNVWLKETGRRATVLSDDRTRRFLESLDGKPGDENQIPTGSVIQVLLVGETPLAIEISLCEAGRFYAYLGAYDMNYKNYAPGKLQMEETQKWAKSQGISIIDFLGEPAEYKENWTNTTDKLETRSVPVSFKGFLYGVFWKAYIRPTLKNIFVNLNPETRVSLLRLFGFQKDKTENKADNCRCKEGNNPSSCCQTS